MPPTDINSQDYWNGRFDADWEVNQGREQSRFFSHVAYENMPAWLLQQIRQSDWTVCDWGCAQGDGTDTLSSYFGAERMVGVDFAASAIEKARRAYPGIRFEVQDWLTETAASETFNVVFSSNTLEHFSQPYDVLPRLLDRAGNCVVLALPFMEVDRIDEHFATFMPENIPVTPGPGWVLVHAGVEDCRDLEPTHWFGHQIVLVYARASWLQTAGLHLADLRFPPSAVQDAEAVNRAFGGVLNESMQALRQMHDESLAQAQAASQLTRQLAEQLASVAERLDKIEDARAAEIDGLQKELASMRESTSWVATRPLRWLGRLLGRR